MDCRTIIVAFAAFLFITSCTTRPPLIESSSSQRLLQASSKLSAKKFPAILQNIACVPGRWTYQNTSNPWITTDETNVVSAEQEGDTEVDHDDWTSVVFNYTTEVVNDKEIWLTVTWATEERNSNKSRGDTKLVSRTREKVFSLSAIEETPCVGNNTRIVEHTLKAMHEDTDWIKWPKSQLCRLFFCAHHEQRAYFNRSGVEPESGDFLYAQMYFDGRGRHDHTVQSLEAILGDFEVTLLNPSQVVKNFNM